MQFNAWTAAITFLLGAATAFIPTALNEYLKERRARKYRWDIPLYDLSKEFVSKSRRLVHLCGRYDRAKDQDAARAEIDSLFHVALSVVQQLRILADKDCNEHARAVQRHLYAVRATLAEGLPHVRDESSTSPSPAR